MPFAIRGTRVKRETGLVEMLVRQPVVPPNRRSFGIIRQRGIWAPRSPGLKAFVHSILGLHYTGFARHFAHGVAVAHHGPGYARGKWSSIARSMLRYGERLAPAPSTAARRSPASGGGTIRLGLDR